MTKPLPNEDADVDPTELEAVENESPGEPRAPELTAGNASLTEWDEPVGAVGGLVPNIRPEGDVSTAEQFIEQGLDAADRDQRLAAVDPDFEP